MKFLDILKQYNVPTAPPGHHHTRSGWDQFDCPYCGPGARVWHMGHNNATGACACWRCGPHSRTEVLVLVTGASWGTIKKLIGDVQLDRNAPNRPRARGKLELPGGIGPMARPHRRYLAKRGFDPDEIEELWGVGGIGIASRNAWRLFIPIHHRGEIVSFTTRTIGDKGLRYVSASPDEEVLEHKRVLYGEDFVRHGIVVCEGPTGPWRIGPGATATLGVGYTHAQLLAISRRLVRAVCFDPEPEAQRRARELCDALSAFPGDTYNIVLDSEDSGAASRREVRRIRRHFLD